MTKNKAIIVSDIAIIAENKINPGDIIENVKNN